MKITSSSHTTAGMSVLVTLSLVEFDLACFVVAEGFTVLLYPFSVADETLGQGISSVCWKEILTTMDI